MHVDNTIVRCVHVLGYFFLSLMEINCIGMTKLIDIYTCFILKFDHFTLKTDKCKSEMRCIIS